MSWILLHMYITGIFLVCLRIYSFLIFTRAEIIQDEVGVEHPKSIIATTILSYALSSVLTGIVFLLMGMFKVNRLYTR